MSNAWGSGWIAHGYLLWLPTLLRADGGRGDGDLRPGLTGRFRGGEVRVMPLASSLGASHDFQSDAPLFVNSWKDMKQTSLRLSAIVMGAPRQNWKHSDVSKVLHSSTEQQLVMML